MSPNFCFVLVLAVLSASNVKGKSTSEERLIRLVRKLVDRADSIPKWLENIASDVHCLVDAAKTADLCIDLTSGIVNGTVSSANGFAWHSALTSSSSPCTRQGVLKLTFNNSTRKRAEIFMRFSNSTDWSFN
ncbi:hypothetical protein BaRGS_00033821, partial [Batillaria attramentaria]